MKTDYPQNPWLPRFNSIVVNDKEWQFRINAQFSRSCIIDFKSDDEVKTFSISCIDTLGMTICTLRKNAVPFIQALSKFGFVKLSPPNNDYSSSYNNDDIVFEPGNKLKNQISRSDFLRLGDIFPKIDYNGIDIQTVLEPDEDYFGFSCIAAYDDNANRFVVGRRFKDIKTCSYNVESFYLDDDFFKGCSSIARNSIIDNGTISEYKGNYLYIPNILIKNTHVFERSHFRYPRYFQGDEVIIKISSDLNTGQKVELFDMIGKEEFKHCTIKIEERRILWHHQHKVNLATYSHELLPLEADNLIKNKNFPKFIKNTVIPINPTEFNILR